MVQINEVSIISIDKSDEVWSIEGEILFESDLTTAFSLTYDSEYDEIEDLELDINPGKYDQTVLKEMIVTATYEYDE